MRCSQLDDSGVFKDLEDSDLTETEDVPDGSNGLTELDDKSFFTHLQPKLEKDIETKSSKQVLTTNADRCRRFVWFLIF